MPESRFTNEETSLTYHIVIVGSREHDFTARAIAEIETCLAGAGQPPDLLALLTDAEALAHPLAAQILARIEIWLKSELMQGLVAVIESMFGGSHPDLPAAVHRILALRAIRQIIWSELARELFIMGVDKQRWRRHGLG